MPTLEPADLTVDGTVTPQEPDMTSDDKATDPVNDPAQLSMHENVEPEFDYAHVHLDRLSGALSTILQIQEARERYALAPDEADTMIKGVLSQLRGKGCATISALEHKQWLEAREMHWEKLAPPATPERSNGCLPVGLLAVAALVAWVVLW